MIRLTSERELINVISGNARRLSPPYHHIMDSIGDQVQVVMIGEASHGTEDFYRIRAELTKQLIRDKGFTIVAVESDFPDAFRANRYIRPDMPSRDSTAEEALRSFKRFPTWMWRNEATRDFMEWMKKHNSHLHDHAQRIGDTPVYTGFYGLDIYSLSQSREEVIRYLDRTDKEAAKIARKHYGCFDYYGGDSDRYAQQALSHSCQENVVKVLRMMLERQNEMIQHDLENNGAGKVEDGYYYAKQNAQVVKKAEEYYRNMFGSGAKTWNIRDTGMVDTLLSLMQFKREWYSSGEPVKAIVWAHNSHLGDSSKTEMHMRGEVNVGRLVRERIGLNNTFNIGFTTYDGTVTAAHNWDEEPQFMRVRKGMERSYEKLFHDAGAEMFPGDQNFSLVFKNKNASMPEDDKETQATPACTSALDEEYLQRAIGVIYRPKTERWSHYFDARIASQFDAVIHVDHTRALVPLDKHPQWLKSWKEHDIAETYPFSV